MSKWPINYFGLLWPQSRSNNKVLAHITRKSAKCFGSWNEKTKNSSLNWIQGQQQQIKLVKHDFLSLSFSSFPSSFLHLYLLLCHHHTTPTTFIFLQLFQKLGCSSSALIPVKCPQPFDVAWVIRADSVWQWIVSWWISCSRLTFLCTHSLICMCITEILCMHNVFPILTHWLANSSDFC